MTPIPNDFETMPTGTIKALDAKDLQIQHLRSALNDIIDMESCLLADAKEIASNALEVDQDVDTA